jgi:hypothetical protein
VRERRAGLRRVDGGGVEGRGVRERRAGLRRGGEGRGGKLTVLNI